MPAEPPPGLAVGAKPCAACCSEAFGKVGRACPRLIPHVDALGLSEGPVRAAEVSRRVWPLGAAFTPRVQKRVPS